MRKLILFIHASLIALALISCGGNEPDVNKDPDDGKDTVVTDASEARLYKCDYYGDSYGNGGENFVISFLTEDLYAQGAVLQGAGSWVTLNINAKSHVDWYPATGEYKFVDNSETIPVGTAMAGFEVDLGVGSGMEPGAYIFSGGTYARRFKENGSQDIVYVVDGSVVVKGSRMNAEIIMDLVYNDGTNAKYLFKGAIEDVDDCTDLGGGEGGEGGDDILGGIGGDYSYEPDQPAIFEKEFTSINMKNYGDYYENGATTYYFTLRNDDHSFGGHVVFFADANSTSPVGTYEINTSGNVGSCQASPGGDESYDYPSFIYTDIIESGYTTAFYLRSGTLTITENSIEINAMTKKGSAVKLTYSGDVVADPVSTSMAIPHKAIKAD